MITRLRVILSAETAPFVVPAQRLPSGGWRSHAKTGGIHRGAFALQLVCEKTQTQKSLGNLDGLVYYAYHEEASFAYEDVVWLIPTSETVSISIPNVHLQNFQLTCTADFIREVEPSAYGEEEEKTLPVYIDYCALKLK